MHPTVRQKWLLDSKINANVQQRWTFHQIKVKLRTSKYSRWWASALHFPWGASRVWSKDNAHCTVQTTYRCLNIWSSLPKTRTSIVGTKTQRWDKKQNWAKYWQEH
jgi:hypothetical protein